MWATQRATRTVATRYSQSRRQRRSSTTTDQHAAAPASISEAGAAACWSVVVDERRCLLLCEYRVATVLVARCVAHIKLLDCERREFVRESGRDFGRDVRLFADGAHDRVSSG